MNVQSHFPPRPADSHKGTYGTLLSVCGSYGMAGAAFLAAKAALRCGTGLVVAAVPESIYPIVATALPEAVYVPYATQPARALLPRLDTANALLCGCGLGTDAAAVDLVTALLTYATCPVVLDADGINIAARHILLSETVRAPLILTPHPKELSRLLHCSVDEIQRDRHAAVTAAVAKTGGTVVLKGHRTLVAAPDGRVYENTTGNAGMAVGGSGDVLAGMIAAFVAQGMAPFDAACVGVYLHGKAGDNAAARLSQHAMLPSDMLDELSGLFLSIEQQE